MTPPPTIVWFRNDLRLSDNPALTAAVERGHPIIPVYIFPLDDFGGATKWWLHHSLESLRKQLPSLILRTGSPLEVLTQITKETGADAVFWNRCYEPASIARDSKIKATLLASDVEVKSYCGNLLFEPWTVLNKQKRPFQVFTPFWKACLERDAISLPLPKPKKINGYEGKIFSNTLKDFDLLPHIHWDSGLQKKWEPGELGAQKKLEHFLPKVDGYGENRDFPAIEGISLLSPYLHFGEISPRTVWNIVKQHPFKHSEIYLRQLGWREFAHHLLYHFPRTPTHPLRDNFLNFPWETNPSALKAWQKGLTGYPIVDAGMRQLWKTGWMHNRVRMIVGSFLVKDLLISWQDGAAWFWDTLVDADLANNTLGWQWIGGCGADAAPYFRIFNPITQGEKFDSEGTYVKEWIPELAHLPSKWIHKPWEAPPLVLRQAGISLGKDYPYPIVDHNKAREKALAAFASLKLRSDSF